MSRPDRLRTLKGLSLAAIAVVALLLLPVALTWGSKARVPSSLQDKLDQMDYRKTRNLPRVTAVERPGDLSPFGPGFKEDASEKSPQEKKHQVETAIGWVDLRHPDNGVLHHVPATLRDDVAGLRDAGNRGRGHTHGVNIVQVDEEAMRARGYEAIESDIRRHARILDEIPERAFVVRVANERDFDAIAALSFVEAIGPYEPAFKVSPKTGRIPLIQASRAHSHEIDLIVSLWADADPAETRAALESIAGKEKVSPWSADGTVFQVHASPQAAARVARHAGVRSMEERPEFMLTNSETPTLMMIGNTESAFGMARPYHDVGIDGGGIDADINGTADGRRINNDSDVVPPQIVVVTDNGISYDAVHFSQTLTQPISIAGPIGPTHRKVHAIQTVEDNGQSCDDVLSGSNTHGNVVAGIIAGAPGDFGLTYTKAMDPSDGPPISGIRLDALARGSRIIMQDAALPNRCLQSELVEVGGNLNPQNLLDRLNLAICPKSGAGPGACSGVVGGGYEAHLHVMPFGVPNFDNLLTNPENGTYPLESRQIDTFLVNNRDYMVFSPVGSQGNMISGTSTTEVWPDLFNGTALDNDPNTVHPLQIPPPATAKNVVTVGGGSSDLWTVFGDYNDEENPLGFSSKGPATPAGRTAPIVMAPGSDGSGIFAYPMFITAATNRSHDNDNSPPVENEIDEGNTGTSFSAGFATAAGAIMRDYFAQGFYPTGSRVQADRMSVVSGSLVRAGMVASANFMEYLVGDIPSPIPNTSDQTLFYSRGTNMGTVSGVPVGVIGNNVQGYGRIVISNLLPISIYPPTIGMGGPDTVEYPAAGLIVYDMLGTGEAPINNSTNLQTEKTFKVDGVNAITLGGGTRAIQNGQLRIALSWPDPPSAEASTGALVNDLDLEVESPGNDNCLTAADTKPDGTACPGNATADNKVYDGNVYISGQGLPSGQWGQARAIGDTPVHDLRNNIEAVHLSAFGGTAGNQLPTGSWKVRVKRGAGGATPGQITQIAQADEDANHNGRFDGAETDFDADGLLDAGGQPFALVIAGPVFGSGSQTWNSLTHNLPASTAKLDKYQYSCADNLVATVVDAGATPSGVGQNVVFQVVDAAGAVLDQENFFLFTETAANSHVFRSVSIPTRLANPPATGAVKYDGVLEGDNGQVILMTYTDAPRNAEARARFQCTPNIQTAQIDYIGRGDPAAVVTGGCDGDTNLDSGEHAQFSIALRNYEKADDLDDVEASLTPSGAGAAAVVCLDCPKSIGRVPGGQTTGVTFALYVDPAAAAGLTAAPVTLTLTLDGKARGVRTSRSSFAFQAVVNADKESLHYSTDFPNGGRQVRDFNRNVQIDRPDVLDPFKGVYWPDEDITFASMFVANSARFCSNNPALSCTSDAACTPGVCVGPFISNTLGEDLDNSGKVCSDNLTQACTIDANCTPPAVCLTFTGAERDIVPNGLLDKGILLTSNPNDVQRVPFNFDRNNGGWLGLRHPDSKATGVPAVNMWEYKTSGACGFQTAVADGNPAGLFQAPGAGGIWHTGDTNPATPSGQVCDGYPYPNDGATPMFEEVVFDILTSPIISKVNQNLDVRGFPYTVEFQRLGVNINMQTEDYAGGDIDFDSDIDRDQGNCLLCEYWYYRFGDNNTLMALEKYTDGVDPKSAFKQRTFGPTSDPNGSLTGGNPLVSGDETGFTGFTANTNLDSTSPIPVAPPDFRPFPSPGAPVVCVPGCVDPDPNPPDMCCEQNTVEGPERNLDLALMEYDDGYIYTSLGPGLDGPTGGFAPGPAGNRWQIGIGFWVWENPSGKTDYGLGVDDVVLEWDEVHPIPEPGGSPACSRFGGIGQPAGQQCATLSIDRLFIYECNESIGVTVDDPRRAGTGSVIVYGVTDTDNTPVPTGVVVAKHPIKQFSIPEVSPGLFRGNVTIGTLFNNANLLFSNPNNDSNMTFYYIDPECDGDHDGITGETSFTNLDNDGVPTASDNCPHDYNPAPQADTDGDGVGNVCDNCPGVANADQRDSDADSVGDACDFDDIDFDGVVNDIDNCPDVYNPLQIAGTAGKGTACDKTSQDVDGDGVSDRNDKCVRTANPAPQLDNDNDGIGNACDGDCGNPQKVLLATGSCSRSNDIVCPLNPCPTTGHCSIRTTRPCVINQDCAGGGSGQEICIDIAPETCQRFGVSNNGTCPSVGDDLDGDLVPDALDNCPTVSNPTVVPGAIVQPDVDSDGRGDACDPPQTLDDDNNGIPDDAITFNLVVACKKLPLAGLVLLGKQVADIGPPNGDNDPFPDAGETARMSVVVKNASGFDLTNATLILSTIDPDVACVTKSTIAIGTLANGATIDTASLGNPAGRFEFVVSQSTSTSNPASPAKLDFSLSVASTQAVGTSVAVPVTALADLDLPSGGLPARVAGPDGIPGNSDDGLIFEDFDTERDGTPQITLSNLPRGTPGVLNDTIGVWVGTAPGGINTLAGIGCAGFFVPPQDKECRIDPDNDMDWHIHCPAGTCPNSQGLVTPSPDGPLAKSGQNSLHWGHHFLTTSRDGDSVKFRQLAAFMTDPINLTPVPNVGDLELSFYHIADQMDNNNYNAPTGQANDFGDVHIQVFDASAPGGGQWGFWDKLQPFQNVYDHISYIWSAFGTGTTFCTLTPTDTGTGGYAPRGVKETMCYPQGIWSHCGNSRDASSTWQCHDADDQGHVGVAGNLGPGLWMQSKFSLANYLGQTIRIRWIAESWEFDCCSSSYYEAGGTWSPEPGDEGWWIDDIRITGAIVSPGPPSADTKAPAPGTCPGSNCNSGLGSDHGFNVDLTLSDSDGNGIIVGGEKIALSAAATTNPGGCVGGGPQFRFYKDGIAPANVVQDWSSDPTFVDYPTADAVYHVQARCSTSPTGCLTDPSTAAATESAYVCNGMACGDIILNLTNTRGRCFTAAGSTGTNTSDTGVFCNADSECGAGAFCGVGVCTAGTVPAGRACNVDTNCGAGGACNANTGANERTTVSFLSRPQLPAQSGYDAYVGSIPAAGDAGQATLAGIACMAGGHIAQPPGPPEQAINLTDTVNPLSTQVRYFLVGQNPVNPPDQVLLGRRSTGALRTLQPVCP